MVFHKQDSLKTSLSQHVSKQKKIGFVPTMGALHKGHLSLVKKALKENDVVAVSVFVNPTQFDNASDLKKYPRTLDADVALLNTLKGTILIYAPDASDLYGEKVSSTHYRFGGIEHQMEGKYRKGHFDGVGTVLNLLFRAVQPNKAYFGEKDFQQLQIVKKLVEIENLPIKIIGCPIMREPNGLAMSSRNKRLSSIQFEEAALIYKTLKEVQQHFDKESIASLHKLVAKRFSENKHLTLEYFEITAIKNLKPAHRKIKGNTYRAFIAAFAGDVRLIDNIALN
ncbi:MAG: pantoate--beta-alanine ligase [Flavobacteriaceae bacterium]|nr:pantoate--beta-alanine ligase [Flavobacteriaceae bacterium]|tara:strand:- start:62281 stop:63126 length:846 start_codon:yes stop_codon:yes gene_type:complete